MPTQSQHVSLDVFEYTDARALITVNESLRQEFVDSDSTAPLRVVLGPRDDLSFLDLVESQLIEEGVDADVSARAAATVLLAPSASAMFQDRVFQAVVVTPDADADDVDFPYRIAVSARISTSGHQTAITDLRVTFLQVDLDDMVDLGHLAVELSEVAKSFPAPAASSRRFKVVVLGKPIGAEYPATGQVKWNELLKGFERVFGIDLEILTDQSRIRDPFSKLTQVIVALDPAFVGVAMKVGKVPVPPVIDTSGESPEGIAVAVAILIRNRFVELDGAGPTGGTRDLAAGERVFHRKIGTSVAFDRFGPATKPCSHPIEKYHRYHAAPKAEKGMKRLYSNFEGSMLYHCGRDYSCGMYAVFAPAKL